MKLNNSVSIVAHKIWMSKAPKTGGLVAQGSIYDNLNTDGSEGHGH